MASVHVGACLRTIMTAPVGAAPNVGTRQLVRTLQQTRPNIMQRTMFARGRVLQNLRNPKAQKCRSQPHSHATTANTPLHYSNRKNWTAKFDGFRSDGTDATFSLGTTPFLKGGAGVAYYVAQSASSAMFLCVTCLLIKVSSGGLCVALSPCLAHPYFPTHASFHCANGAPGVSLFHCSVSGPHTRGVRT